MEQLELDFGDVRTDKREPVGVTLSPQDLARLEYIQQRLNTNRSSAIRFCVQKVHDAMVTP